MTTNCHLNKIQTVQESQQHLIGRLAKVQVDRTLVTVLQLSLKVFLRFL